MTDHFLLMTATPHKGDPENFCLFLSLLDRDVYGNIKSLARGDATARSALLPPADEGGPGLFPDPVTGAVRSSSRSGTSTPPRSSSTATSSTSTTTLTRYVEDQSDQGVRGRQRCADGRSPSRWRMLQRRFGIQRLRRTSQPGADARQAREDPRDPENYRQEQIAGSSSRRLRRAARGRADGDRGGPRRGGRLRRSSSHSGRDPATRQAHRSRARSRRREIEIEAGQAQEVLSDNNISTTRR